MLTYQEWREMQEARHRGGLTLDGSQLHRAYMRYRILVVNSMYGKEGVKTMLNRLYGKS